MVVSCSVAIQKEIWGLAFNSPAVLHVMLGKVAEIPFLLRQGTEVSFDIDLGDGNTSSNLTDAKVEGALFVAIYSHNYSAHGTSRESSGSGSLDVACLEK